MTNSEKFESVFGFKPSDDAGCVAPAAVCDIQDGVCNDCPFDNWWNKEYKACFKILEGLNDRHF